MAITKYKQTKANRKAANLKIVKNNVIFKKSNFKPRKSNFKSKKPLRRRRKKTIAPVAKPPSLLLNIRFYNALEGVYNSYWAGKLVATLQRHGKKKTVAKHFYRAATILKLSLSTTAILLLLEVLDRIKPTFRLRNRIRRRSIKEYPVVVLRPRRLILAVHWLKEEIRASSTEFGSSLASEIAGKLLHFKLSPKKNNLVKKRNEYTRRTIKAQFNIRYDFK